MGSYKFPDTLADRTGSRIVIARAFCARGNLGKAVAISPMASQLSGRVLRDCHVASLLAMTRQESARCTSALARLNCPPRGAQGTPLQTQLVPIVLSPDCSYRQCAAGSGMPLPYNFLSKYAKNYRKHRLPVIFTINYQLSIIYFAKTFFRRAKRGRPSS